MGRGQGRLRRARAEFGAAAPLTRLSALLDALTMVRYALGWVPWAQDVALIA